MTRLTDQRASGILMHISSLPGGHGIGDLGRSSHEFIDFLANSGQSYWQILPLGPVSPVFGNSPYMSHSAFAGNPLFISLETLVDEGLITANDLPTHVFSPYHVDFSQVATLKKNALRAAWNTFLHRGDRDTFEHFTKTTPWVNEYALFMALKAEFIHAAWNKWPEKIKKRDPETLKKIRLHNKQEIDYFLFEQFIFFKQWKRLLKYAHSQGIKIIGDLPIYVGHDSADVWAHQNIFELSPETGSPVHVAGVPPDYFSKTGQRWGNPLYRWNSPDNTVKEELYGWWENRFRSILATVDVIRIDHFRGFAAYWSIPFNEKTAVNGVWKKGPGKEFFQAMDKQLGKLPVIAEDLGTITPEVEKLRDDLQYPGMKILLFAFNSSADSPYLPQNFSKNCVVYTGTHDNDTAVGWFFNPDIALEVKKRAKKYANKNDIEAASFHHDIVYLAQSSVACLSIMPLQDILGFGNDCRMNTPGTTSGNWTWRCAASFLSNEIAEKLHKDTALYGRIPVREKDGYIP